jgi:hypothetical protein
VPVERDPVKSKPHHPLPIAALLLLLALLAPGGIPRGHAQFATRVLHYHPGTKNTSLYTNAPVILGEPSRVTPGEWGGPVTPFYPAYLPSQLLSITAGGSLTVEFDPPIQNLPGHRFGFDFLVFGGTGFMVTNDLDPDWNYIGIPTTDGSLFGVEPLTGRVQVSTNGVDFITLNPQKIPGLGDVFPTEGTGDFHRPVGDVFNPARFAGMTLGEVQKAYDGAGGGVGFDLDWAQDASGNPIPLASVSVVRLEIDSGEVELDAFTLVATEAPRPEVQLDPKTRQVGFVGHEHWLYTLEASADLNTWSALGEAVPGTGTPLTLTDTRTGILPGQFYRVVAKPDFRR